MSETVKLKYTADVHCAELYDLNETQTHDVDLIFHLLGPRENLLIFEPFCGTGRISLPLAMKGHRLIALDDSSAMLDRFRQKLQAQPQAVRDRVQLIQSPVFANIWPERVDVVLLGGNCMYEVSSSDEQRALVLRAASAVCRGGHVFIDSDDHKSLELSPKWQKPPGQINRRKTGICQDGTRLESSSETAWFDVRGRFVHDIRRLTVTHPDGTITQHEWRETCRPIVMQEILAWGREAGLTVEQTFNGAIDKPYVPGSGRATVWARKE